MAKNLLKVAPKKRRVITPRGLDAKHFGEEPTWDDQAFLNEDELNSRLGKAYNWYNYFYEAKEGRRYLNDYMTEQGFSKAAQTMLNRTSDAKLNSTRITIAKANEAFSASLVRNSARRSLAAMVQTCWK